MNEFRWTRTLRFFIGEDNRIMDRETFTADPEAIGFEAVSKNLEFSLARELCDILNNAASCLEGIRVALVPKAVQ